MPNQMIPRIISVFAVGIAIWLFLPLIVYVQNLTSVDIPKTSILLWGSLLWVATATVLFAFSLIPRMSHFITITCQIITITIVFLVVFPIPTAEITGFSETVVTIHIWDYIKLLMCVVAGILLAFYRPDLLRQVTTGALVLCIASTLGTVLLFSSIIEKTSHVSTTGNNSLVELGTEPNVLVIVLDAFTGYRMLEMQQSHPELCDRFDGFTLYPNAVAPALNTPAGLSILLTGSLNLAINEKNKI